jgi:hypothetical protein
MSHTSVARRSLGVGYESLDDDDLEPVTIDGRRLWIAVAPA